MSFVYIKNIKIISDNKPQRSVGLDLGNSSSIVSTFDDQVQHTPGTTPHPNPNPITL
jgi:plasmid segregation protein ParM